MLPLRTCTSAASADPQNLSCDSGCPHQSFPSFMTPISHPQHTGESSAFLGSGSGTAEQAELGTALGRAGASPDTPAVVADGCRAPSAPGSTDRAVLVPWEG